MVLLNTSIEIAASPAEVRAKFLDFASVPKYHKGHFKAIIPENPDRLEPGSKINVQLEGASFNGVVLENTLDCVSWVGKIPLLFSGEHRFLFQPSKVTPAGTTLVQEEEFTGIFGFLMGNGFLVRPLGAYEKTRHGFNLYNEDLKKWCEGGSALQG